jgi:DNA polymerase-3 subunit epsilon
MAQINKYISWISAKISKPIVVFDLETTGIDTGKDEIVQFAGIRIDPKTGDSVETKELTFICKPSIPVDPRAAEVHGFTDDKLKKQPPFKKFIPKILSLFDGADVAGFNLASFDVKILSRQMQAEGQQDFMKDAAVYDAYKVFCTHCTRKLADALMFYTNDEIEDAHDALGDVKTTIAVIASQVSQEQSTVAEIAQKTLGKTADKVISDQYIIYNDKKEPVLNFSKHKGTLIKDVDKGFIKWVLGKDFPKSVKDILRQYT